MIKQLTSSNIEITPELARLHANICGDGYMCVAKCKRSKKELKTHSRKNIYRIRFSVRYCNNERAFSQRHK